MSHADQYDETYFQDGAAEKDTRVLEALVDLAAPHLSKPARVLDVGCASGRLLEVLRERGYTQLAGMDISGHAVQATIDKGFEDVYQANLQDGTPLAPGTYNAIFMLDVIEHFTRPYDALHEVRRLLAPGGYYCLLPRIPTASYALCSASVGLSPTRVMYSISPRLV